jgi:hypothetical protein
MGVVDLQRDKVSVDTQSTIKVDLQRDKVSMGRLTNNLIH